MRQGINGRSLITTISLIAISIVSIYIIYSNSDIIIYSFFHRITNYLLINLDFINPEIDNLILFICIISVISFSRISKIKRTSILAAFLTMSSIFIIYFPQFLSTFLSSCSIILIFSVIFGKIVKRSFVIVNLDLVVKSLSATIIIFSFISLLITFSFWFGFESELMFLRNYGNEIYSIFSSLSPLYIIIILFTLPIKLISDFFAKIFKHKKEMTIKTTPRRLQNSNRKGLFVGMILVLLLSILIVYLPHTPFLNQESKTISVDTGNYGYSVKTLSSNDSLANSFAAAFNIKFGTHPNAISGDRPLTLLFVFTLYKITGLDIDYLVDTILPMFLAPLLVIVIFYLVREISDNSIALLAAFLTAISPQILIGVYAGLFANWLALIVSYFGITMLLRYVKGSKIIYIIIFGLTMVLLRFTHVYTGIVMTAIILGFAIILLYWKRNTVSKIKSKTILIIVALSIPIILGILVQNEFGDISQTNNISGLSKFLTGMNLENLLYSWNNLSYSLNVQNGGIASNFIILGLTIGLLFYLNKSPELSIMTIIIYAVSFIFIFFGNDVIQTRTIYNIPFQIPAAFTLYYLSQTKHGGKIFVISIILVLIAIDLRYISNLVFIYNE